MIKRGTLYLNHDGINHNIESIFFLVTGGYVGLICGNFLSGALTSAFGWEIVFYVLGLLLVIWFCFWTFLCYNEPATHPRISRVRSKDTQ